MSGQVHITAVNQAELAGGEPLPSLRSALLLPLAPYPHHQSGNTKPQCRALARNQERRTIQTSLSKRATQNTKTSECFRSVHGPQQSAAGFSRPIFSPSQRLSAAAAAIARALVALQLAACTALEMDVRPLNPSLLLGPFLGVRCHKADLEC